MHHVYVYVYAMHSLLLLDAHCQIYYDKDVPKIY